MTAIKIVKLKFVFQFYVIRNLNQVKRGTEKVYV